MLQINVMTDSARLVQFEANGPILGRLSQAGVRAQVPGGARDAKCPQRCKVGKQCIRQTDHQRCSFHARKGCSKTPSLIALSSAESELYALVMASAEAMGF